MTVFPRQEVPAGARVDALDCAAGVLRGHRAAVARAITLVESSLPADREAAAALLARLAPAAGRSHRIGVSGVPGAGKSTLIDVLGSELTAAGHRVAVLAIDPSSTITGGSILGDSTRMTRLAADPAAYVRPSPTGGTLGGLCATTGDAVVVVEAAGYDVILIETVGVGQSETAVAEVVDTLLLVAVPGTGDGLQGIKRGLLEHVDLVAVNKADGASEGPARAAARELAGALRLVAMAAGRTSPPVLTCSARDGSGVPELREQLAKMHAELTESGRLAQRRSEQRVARLHAVTRTALLARLTGEPGVVASARAAEAAVRAGSLTPHEGASQILAFLDASATASRTSARIIDIRERSLMGQHPNLGSGGDLAVLTIDHVGVAVPDLDEALAFYTGVLGLTCEHQEVNQEQGVREAMLRAGPDPDGARIQLLAPLNAESPIARFIDKRGAGLQQLAYTVADVEAASAVLRGRGVPLLYDTARRGTAGSLVNFVHPKHTGGVLVELVEKAGSRRPAPDVAPH